MHEQDQRVIRAAAVVQACRADGVDVGSGVDLLLDNMGELRSVDDARAVLRFVCLVCGSTKPADQSCGCFDNGGQ